MKPKLIEGEKQGEGQPLIIAAQKYNLHELMKQKLIG